MIGSDAPSVTCLPVGGEVAKGSLTRGWEEVGGTRARSVYCGGDRTRREPPVATAGEGTSSRMEGGGGKKVQV